MSFLKYKSSTWKKNLAHVIDEWKKYWRTNLYYYDDSSGEQEIIVKCDECILLWR